MKKVNPIARSLRARHLKPQAIRRRAKAAIAERTNVGEDD